MEQKTGNIILYRTADRESNIEVTLAIIQIGLPLTKWLIWFNAIVQPYSGILKASIRTMNYHKIQLVHFLHKFKWKAIVK